MSSDKIPGYRQRIVDSEIGRRLETVGAVVIEGAKACGKTASARELAASEVLLDVDDDARALAEIDPGRILEGATPRLIDEWQLESRIWNHVRRAVDDRRVPGQFILTGSASPADDVTRHTGAMRIGRIRMRPMSLFEGQISSGAVSLASLLEGEPSHSPHTPLDIDYLAELIARGGWPALLDFTAEQAMVEVRAYVEEIARAEITEVEGVRRNPEKIRRLLRSLARNVATHAPIATLAKDAGEPGNPLDPRTAARYLDALARLFVVEDQAAWAPHLRSRHVLRRAAKRHFVDPSIAVAALHASLPDLTRDLNLLGLLFESLVVRDLRIYAQSADARVLQYRDSDDLEVDAIVQASDGRWLAIEVKLGGERSIEQAAESLKRFAGRIDTGKCGEPAALCVITAGGYGYVRSDGIHLVPIAALGP